MNHQQQLFLSRSGGGGGGGGRASSAHHHSPSPSTLQGAMEENNDKSSVAAAAAAMTNVRNPRSMSNNVKAGVGSAYSNTTSGTSRESYPMSNIATPHVNDVLCGRGGGTNNHAGNENFRDLVNEKKRLYLNSSKREKPMVSRSIVETIRSLDPPGRFLQKDEETGLWYDIGDQKAREKTSQALREGAPVIRREIHLTAASASAAATVAMQQLGTTMGPGAAAAAMVPSAAAPGGTRPNPVASSPQPQQPPLAPRNGAGAPGDPGTQAPPTAFAPGPVPQQPPHPSDILASPAAAAAAAARMAALWSPHRHHTEAAVAAAAARHAAAQASNYHRFAPSAAGTPGPPPNNVDGNMDASGIGAPVSAAAAAAARMEIGRQFRDAKALTAAAAAGAMKRSISPLPSAPSDSIPPTIQSSPEAMAAAAAAVAARQAASNNSSAGPNQDAMSAEIQRQNIFSSIRQLQSAQRVHSGSSVQAAAQAVAHAAGAQQQQQQQQQQHRPSSSILAAQAAAQAQQAAERYRAQQRQQQAQQAAVRSRLVNMSDTGKIPVGIGASQYHNHSQKQPQQNHRMAASIARLGPSGDGSTTTTTSEDFASQVSAAAQWSANNNNSPNPHGLHHPDEQQEQEQKQLYLLQAQQKHKQQGRTMADVGDGSSPSSRRLSMLHRHAGARSPNNNTTNTTQNQGVDPTNGRDGSSSSSSLEFVAGGQQRLLRKSIASYEHERQGANLETRNSPMIRPNDKTVSKHVNANAAEPPPAVSADIDRRLCLSEWVARSYADGTATAEILEDEREASLYHHAGLLGIDPGVIVEGLARGQTMKSLVESASQLTQQQQQQQQQQHTEAISAALGRGDGVALAAMRMGGSKEEEERSKPIGPNQRRKRSLSHDNDDIDDDDDDDDDGDEMANNNNDDDMDDGDPMQGGTTQRQTKKKRLLKGLDLEEQTQRKNISSTRRRIEAVLYSIGAF